MLHGVPLPQTGIAEAAGTKKELTPEQEERLKAHLEQSKARVQSRFNAR